MPEIAYRWAGPDDVPTLVDLRAAFLAEITGADPASSDLREALRRYFSGAVPAGQFMACLAESDGRVIATGGLLIYSVAPSAKNLEGREGYIMNMYTMPAFRGRGIATRILEKLLETAQQSCPRVRLHAWPAAVPIYLRAGFAKVESEMKLDFQPSDPPRPR